MQLCSLLRYIPSFRLSPRFFFCLQVFSLLCVPFWVLAFIFVHEPKNSYYPLSSLIQRLHDEQFLTAHALYRSQNMRTDEPRGAVGLRFYTHLDGWRRRHFCSLPMPLHPTSITTFISTPEVRASWPSSLNRQASLYAGSALCNVIPRNLLSGKAPSSHWATRVLGRIQSPFRG